MYKKLKKVKGIHVMKKEDLLKIQAGTLPDCEEGEVPFDGACVPAEHVAMDDGRLTGGTADNCHPS